MHSAKAHTTPFALPHRGQGGERPTVAGYRPIILIDRSRLSLVDDLPLPAPAAATAAVLVRVSIWRESYSVQRAFVLSTVVTARRRMETRRRRLKITAESRRGVASPFN